MLDLTSLMKQRIIWIAILDEGPNFQKIYHKEAVDQVITCMEALMIWELQII